MRALPLMISAMLLAAPALAQALAQAPAAPAGAMSGAPGVKKEEPNPCRDEVASALQKLRKSSWFRMNTSMITENGPTNMQVDYVLPDKMHQKVTVVVSQQSSEVILVGNEAWSSGDGKSWQALPNHITQDLRTQMQTSVVEQQTDVGNYACKGRTQAEGRDVLAYKLEDQPAKDSTGPKNQTYRMFFVDAVTGLPVSNALYAPGRETTPLFKAVYAFPLDMKIEPPKNIVARDGAPAAGGGK